MAVRATHPGDVPTQFGHPASLTAERTQSNSGESEPVRLFTHPADWYPPLVRSPSTQAPAAAWRVELAEGWPLLVALAAESQLSESSLRALARELSPETHGADTQEKIEHRVQRFLDVSLRLGLVTRVARTQSQSQSRKLAREEEGWAVTSPSRQLVLRDARAQEQSAIEAACRTVLGARSLATATLQLQRGVAPGDVSWPSEWSESERRAALRAALLEPFDAEWLERTFGERALPAALTVLDDALFTQQTSSELLEWAASHLPLHPPEEAEHGRGMSGLWHDAARVLSQHFLLRERVALAEQYIQALPLAERLGYLAAAHFVEGDAPRAERLLQQSLTFASPGSAGGKRRQNASEHQSLPRGPFVTPLLALLLLGQRTTTSTDAARRLMASLDARAAGATKAFRTLLRHHAASGALPARIAPTELAPDAGGWETVFLALTVHAHQTHEFSRAAWARLLIQRSIAWLGDSPWLGRQALLIAEALSPSQFEKDWEPARKRLSLPLLRSAPNEGKESALLRDLVGPAPEWELTLEALAQVAAEQSARPECTLRVDWFVNMSDASFGRPGISEYQRGGWTAPRRVDLEELWARRTELAPEDARVLHFSEETAAGRALLPDAWEALIGHPRVTNGARGGLVVEVTRGECRIETRSERGFLTLVAEPARVELGVNAVPEGDARVVVYRVTSATKRVLDLIPRQLRVPVEHQGQALRVLEQLSAGLEVRGSHRGSARTVSANDTPCLRITPVAGAFLLQLGVRPFGPDGRFFVAADGPKLLSQLKDGEQLRTERSFERERTRVSALIAACPTLLACSLEDGPASAEATRWTVGHAGLLTLLSELREAGLSCDVDWPEGPPLRLRGHVSSKSLHGGLRRVKGWYLATGGLSIDDGTVLSLGELATFPSYVGGRFVQLPGGDYLEVEERARRVMAALAVAETVGRPATALRLHESSLHALAPLRDAGGSFTFDPAAELGLSRLEEARHKEYVVPAELNAELRPYQLDGFRWLSTLSGLGLGACLADDMGLGKTVQLIALLLSRAGTGPALVVTPTSVCTNWMRELCRFAPTLDAREYFGSERSDHLERLEPRGGKYPVLVCSYAVLQKDAHLLASVEWGTVVLDEAQQIKNPASQRARAAFSLRAAYRVAATGTPVENHLGDLWSLFHFLNPALLGPWRTFRHRFVLPVERDNDQARREVLRSLVQPYLLRRTKAQVLRELPQVTSLLHEVRLTEEEARLYALLRRQIHEKLSTVHGRRQHKLEVFAEITRLRRFCCHPRLVFPEASSEATKVNVFLDLATELATSGHRALVFSQFVDFLNIVRERLDELGLRYEYLDGSTPQAERQRRVDAFQQGDAPLFLMSLKAGGMGLNLTAADYVIHLDPWWNPAVEAQATDRAHRIGQERPVNVYRLITKDTIEESVVELHQHKRRLADALLAGGDSPERIGIDELLALLGADE